MKSKSVIVILAVAVLCAVCIYPAASRSGARLLAPASDDELNAFDKVVQQRFHDVIGFGMARIASDRQFVPETPAEKDAVKALKRGGFQICLFLVGRGVLKDVPEQERYMNKFGGSSHTIAGPVFTRKNKFIRGLPAAVELWEPARAAFKAFADGGTRYGFKIRTWNVEARPVRASDEKCLSCHRRDVVTYHADGTASIEPNNPLNTLQLGDAVGMVLYAHKNKSDKP
jgi:hypothetical protein